MHTYMLNITRGPSNSKKPNCLIIQKFCSKPILKFEFCVLHAKVRLRQKIVIKTMTCAKQNKCSHHTPLIQSKYWPEVHKEEVLYSINTYY